MKDRSTILLMTLLLSGVLLVWQACAAPEDDGPGTGADTCDPANGDADCNYVEYCAEVDVTDENGFPTGDVKYECILRDTCSYDMQDCAIGWYCSEDGYCFKGTAPKPDNEQQPDDTTDTTLPDTAIPDTAQPDDDAAIPDTVQPDTDAAQTDQTVPDTDTTGVTLDFTEDFESGSDKWTLEGIWQVGTPADGPLGCHGGTSCAGTNLSGNYPDNTVAKMVLSQQITIPTSIMEPVIRFYAYVHSEGTQMGMMDYVEVLVRKSVDNWDSAAKAVFTIADTGLTDNATKTRIGGNGGGTWHLFEASLTPFKGESIQIAFRFTSDEFTNAPGIYIDDIEMH